MNNQKVILVLLFMIIILCGCNSESSDEKYISREIKIGDVLRMDISDLVIKEATQDYTKYYYWYYTERTGGRNFCITTDKTNKILAIWSSR